MLSLQLLCTLNRSGTFQRLVHSLDVGISPTHDQTALKDVPLSQQCSKIGMDLVLGRAVK